jgi:hypothetical protein
MLKTTEYNAPLLRESGDKSPSIKGNSPVAVQHLTGGETGKNVGIPATAASVLDKGLMPIADAANALGIEPKRLLGYMFRNGIGDPIGDGLEVYGWSCATLAKRIADHSSEVQS